MATLPKIIGDESNVLEAVLPHELSIPIPVWLTSHRELRESKRIRLVYDILIDVIRGIRGT